MDAISGLSERSYVEYQRRVESCMVQRGFDYVPIAYADEPVELRRSQNPLNEQTATGWGYHTPPTSFDEAIDTNVHSPAFDEALEGADHDVPSQGPGQDDQTPTGSLDSQGCARPAGQLVFAVTENVFPVVQELLDALYTAVDGYQASPEGQVVLNAWADCMRAKGFDLASPQEGRDRFAGTENVTADELTTRAADLECDRATQLTETQSAWERERFERWQQDFAAPWSELSHLIDNASSELADLEAADLG